MRIPSFTFDARIYEGEATLVYAGTRDADGLPIVGKLVTGGMRDLRVELEILQRVAGPGVVEVLGVFDSSEGPALVQHRFGDGSLAEALHGGAFSVQRALEVAAAIADVLTHVHSRRILHRDIKPANILFDSRTDTIAVADFGIAMELPVHGRQLAPLDLIGTPAYLSPEQTGRTSEGCDVRSDLYSLGVLLFELLTGEVPFVSKELAEVVAAHLSRVPQRPSERNPAVPEQVDAIVLKLLAKSQDARYQSARGLAVDLRRCLSTLDASGHVAPFELACSDLLRPEPTRTLYARDVERDAFLRALESAEGGTPACIIVAGEPGSGRTTFINRMLRDEIGAALCAYDGWREGDERPLSAISRALSRLASFILRRDDDEITQIRELLAKHLGQIGRVIVDISPDWGHVLGEQPELPPLGPQESRTRLRLAFRRFAQALGERNLFVLALGAVDRADPASVDLVNALLDPDEDARVLVVASTRSLGAGPGCGVVREDANTSCVELRPLPVDAVTAWVAELLRCDPERSKPLAEILHEKTGGNPGALTQLIEHFVDIGVVERNDGVFEWDLAQVAHAPAPPSLAAHTAQRVAKLRPERRALLAAIAAGDEACGDTELAAMLEGDPETVLSDLAALEREGLIVTSAAGGFAVSYEEVGQSALSEEPSDQIAALRGRLATHLLESRSDASLAEDPFRIATLLIRGEVKLEERDRPRAARLFELAANQALAVAAYVDSAGFFERGAELVSEGATEDERAQRFRMQVGFARSLMMLGEHARAAELLASICARDLTPEQIGVAYPSRIDNHSAVMDREAALASGLEGLARLGHGFPDDPPLQDSIALLMKNEAGLAAMSIADHVALHDATDASAIAAVQIISTLSIPIAMLGRNSLYLISLERALELHLEHGHTRYYASLLSTHSMLLHSRLGQFEASRRSYEACMAVQRVKPAPEIDGRTYLVLYYLICPWFGPWRECLEPLSRGIDLAIEAGDPVFGAFNASASITLMSMCGAPLDQIADAIDGWWPIMKADAGVAANASNVRNLAGKLSQGERIEQADLDRVSNVSAAAGAMRNNAMVNLALALCVAGHEAQVRRWIEEVHETFPKLNPSQPHLASLWLIEALFATHDAISGRTDRLSVAEERLEQLQQLEAGTRSANHEPAMLLIEAEIARASEEPERASGLYGRAASAARRRELTPIVAYAMERRAQLAEALGCSDDADLFYREAAIAYRRWGHRTKVRSMERERPMLRTLEVVHGRPRHGGSLGVTRTAPRAASIPATHHGTISSTINEAIDLEAVLEVSQQISTQLHAADVVRVVLRGITQNAGAQRVVFVLRDSSGDDVVYGEVIGEDYRSIQRPLAEYAELPTSVLRLSRHTSAPVVIGDAESDPVHASDPFVRASGCRSIAVFPVFRKGSIGGFVLLENRLVPGAFNPHLVELAQSLVAQAAISLDNASLYENLENRVRERTAALNARNAEMRMLFDNVSQGLMMVDRGGTLSSERSAILDTWFPGGVPATLAGFFGDDPMFEIGWDQLIEDLMPIELCIDQLPQLLVHGEQTFEVSWQPISNDEGEMVRMLVVLSDVTEALRRQRAELEQRQLMRIFERLSRDRSGVIEFAEEARAIVAALEAAQGTRDEDKRRVHTLKGNSGLMGLELLSALCHEIESALIAEDRALDASDRARIRDAWGAIDEKLERFLGVAEDVIQVRRSDLTELLARLHAERHPAAHTLELWQLEPLEARFERIGEQARELAARLGKAPLDVVLEHRDLRIEGERWSAFWAAFVHAIRNAIDHGLEPAAERAALGKGVATIQLSAELDDVRLVVALRDDGRGIAWERVRAKARAAGLACESHDDLVTALFADGVSTKESADELSGRGVGMAALEQACRQLGGTIEVSSRAGAGTTWRFCFPAALAARPRALD